MTPAAWPTLTQGGLIGRIYVGDHYTLLHTKYISSRPHGFREEDLKVFPIISLRELMTPGRDHFGPKGLDRQDLCRGPLNIFTY